MKLRIYFKSFSKKPLNESLKFLMAQLSKIDNAKCYSVALPTRIKKFCVLRSPHMHKDSREEFEIRIYKRFIDISSPNIANIFSIFENFSLPSGVACFFGFIENN